MQTIDILGWGFFDLERPPLCDVTSKCDHLYLLWSTYIKKPMLLVEPILGSFDVIDFSVQYLETICRLVLIDASVSVIGKPDAVVSCIGRYIGGLCCAGLYIRNDHNVLELKQLAGGASHCFDCEGYNIDYCSSLFSDFHSIGPQITPLAQVLDALVESILCTNYDSWLVYVPKGEFLLRIFPTESFKDLEKYSTELDSVKEWRRSLDANLPPLSIRDGLDTRPYRLNWPTSTLIFDICPEEVFRGAIQKLQDAGAKIPRGCMSFHVPSESLDIENILCSKGFSGNRPSIWAFQGLPVVNLENFKDILSIVSNLAMKGCLFLGELPVWLAETEVGDQSATKKWLNDLFMTYGFRVKLIEYEEVARKLCKDSARGASGVGVSILFVAEHLLFSDDQMETWRREFQRIEEEADEEGFEEL